MRSSTKEGGELLNQEIKIFRESCSFTAIITYNAHIRLLHLYNFLVLQYEAVTAEWVGKSGAAFSYLCWYYQIILYKGTKELDTLYQEICTTQISFDENDLMNAQKMAGLLIGTRNTSSNFEAELFSHGRMPGRLIRK